jgi:hypothetical protein
MEPGGSGEEVSPLVLGLQRDLKAAKLQTDLMSREMVSVHEEHSMVVRALLRCQGVLAKFQLPAVRKDFLGGKVVAVTGARDILRSLDIFSDILLPEPSTALSGKDEYATEVFVARLLSRSDKEPEDRCGAPLPVRKPYSEWRAFLNSVMLSEYWKEQRGDTSHRGNSRDVSEDFLRGVSGSPLPSEVKSPGGSLLPVDAHGRPASQTGKEVLHNRKLKPLAGRFDSSILGESSDGRGREGRPAVHVERTARRSESTPKKTTKKKRQQTRNNRSRRQPVSSDSSTASSPDSDSSGSVLDDRRPALSDRKRATSPELKRFEDNSKTVVNLEFPKDVVQPVVFSGLEGESMKRFLKSFERYFLAKFNGTQRDMSAQVGRFMRGPAKAAFDALGGSRVGYDQLAPKMQQWYSSNRSGLANDRVEEFQQATMNKEDSLNLLCMRLERLAEQAYPNSRRERERQLCQKFQRSVPASFIEKLDFTRIALGAVEKKLSWECIKKVVETVERQERDKSKVRLDEGNSALWYTHAQPSVASSRSGHETEAPRSSATGGPPRPYVQRSGNNQRVFVRSPPKRFGWDNGRERTAHASGPRPLFWCTYCGRARHEEKDCWLRQNACSRCGNRDHQRAECPRQLATPSLEIPRGQLRCSRCEGPHLGKDCQSQGGAIPKSLN